ncbi:sensor histidine kinase [Thalassotalea ganghwensis]
MALVKSKSLEAHIIVKLAFLFVLMSTIIAALLWQIGVALHWLIIVLFSMFIYAFWYIVTFKHQVMRAFTRAILHVDAISQEDYNQFSKSSFQQGKVKVLHRQLRVLSERLQEQKSHYDQHVYLVYQLIGQLDSPIIIFNEKQQLTFGNEAFYHLFSQPWQMFRYASASLLGLEYQDQTWQLMDKDKRAKWQIRHSEFINEGETHQLLVFINIEPALREQQLQAWQQIIRVLSHEIRNSLTPVSSMAETLADKSQDQRDKQILEVITERCLHLQSFVDRYTSLSRSLPINCQWLSVKHMTKALQKLFKDIEIKVTSSVEEIWADREFFEQVLINLVKNAQEAKAKRIVIDCAKQDQFYVIEVCDDGQGFSNLQNAFVPLYTTKQNGQGIGLSFCRNVVEQHQGIMEIHNNDEKGVTVVVVLPTPGKTNKNKGSSELN